MNPEIKFGKPRPQYRFIPLPDMKAGMVVVNGYHDPDNLRECVGLYMVLRDADKPFKSSDAFIINFRSGKQYTYAQVERRWSGNVLVGGWLCELRGIDVALVLSE